eukprot:TRINITY_DN69000_c0_g1_i1.p1 TRINITY_DN69000_c0_g1~~TRINITY_DN69000_c0_g1_i1.p1  ORF type:complete len:418 (+),score=69.97 TRINITY_DN69000_c0_g1_i1:45-1256(+)
MACAAPPVHATATKAARKARNASSRRQRWRTILQQGIQSYTAEHPGEFQRCVTRGIPTEFRWEVWRAAVGVDARIKPGLYQELLQMESKWARLVEIDVSRTFPDFDLFDKDQQQSLLRILRAYASFNTEVGYCQGMNFVAGLLMYVCQKEDFRETPRLEKEEDVFWLFVCLMEEGRLRGFYQGRFPLLRRYLWAFDELSEVEIPKLKEHFSNEGVQHGVYLHQWFLTLFINCLPFPMVLVIWDVLICGGLELLLPITVSLLQSLQKTLLELQFEDILRFFKTMRTNEDPSCDVTLVARDIILQGAKVVIPANIALRLNEEFGEPSEVDDYSPMKRTAEESEEITEDGGSGLQLAASYLGRFAPPNPSTLSLDLGLARGVMSWWEDARGNLQRAGLTSPNLGTE